MNPEYVLMYPCLECGEDVPASECYDDMGELMHAMGVTGQAEPHETGSTADELKQVDIQSFANPDVQTVSIREVSSLEELELLPDRTLIWYWITWDGGKIHALMRKLDGQWFSATDPDDDYAYKPIVPAYVMPFGVAW